MTRHLLITATAAAAGAALLVLAPAALATTGPFSFSPIAGSAYGLASSSWTEPYVIPGGFCQQLVKDETVLDVYAGADDLHDMNTVNETGLQAGRYLYNTYEVGSNGAVGVTDLVTGETKVLAQDPGWRRLDGIRWTPWGSLLFAEETTGGRLFELFLDLSDPMTAASVEARPELGILRHEGIEALGDGTTFVIDELNGGSIFRFEPTERGDLSNGQLYALRLTGLTAAEQKWNAGTFTSKVGAFEWVALDMDEVVVDADAAANAVNATEFGRPEDVEVIADTLYVANTSEDRVVAIDLNSEVLTSYVLAGLNVPVEDAGNAVTGFNNPDNLAQGPDGRLWVTEDNDFSDIWATTPDRDHDGSADTVELFASLVDEGAETTGIYFSPMDPKTLYLNIQHPDKALADGTWTISKRCE